MGMTFTWEGFAGLGIEFVLNGFNVIYCIIALFMWTMAALFSLEYMKGYKNKKRYYSFLFMTMFATLFVFLSKDLFTVFIFFEIMSFTSYVWVAFDEKRESMRAAETYLAVAVIGGLTMLMGIFMLYQMCGTLEFEALSIEAERILSLRGENAKLFRIACYLLFVGFAAKAGAFPMHIWLPKAHPVAPAPASALLSGILTKTGIFGVLVIACYLLREVSFYFFLLYIGIITMLLGGLLAIFSVNLKRTIACSSVSQIGFILVGISMIGYLGAHNAIAAYGTFLHMVNHSLFKLLLFMVAGVVYMNLHSLDLNEIRGFGRNKPFLHVVFLCGALGIGGIPGFSGYISKTLLHESIVEGIAHYPYLKYAEMLFLIAGGMTLCYMMKLYIAIFVEKNRDASLQEKYDGMKKSYANKLSRAVLAFCALPLVVFGILPHQTMEVFARLAVPFMKSETLHHEIAYFHFVNLKGGLVSIVIGLILYGFVRAFLMRKEALNVLDDAFRQSKENKVVAGAQMTSSYVNAWPKFLDLEDYGYRPLLEFVSVFAKTIARIMDLFIDSIVIFLRKTFYKDSPMPHELLEGNLLTHELGLFLEWIQKGLNKTMHKKSPTHIKFEHKVAMFYKQISMTNDLIKETMSFGLIIFFAGLIFTMGYLLYIYYVG